MGSLGAFSSRDLLRRSAVAGGAVALLPAFAADEVAGGGRKRQRRPHAYSFFASEAVNFEALFAFGAVGYGTADFGELTAIADRINAMPGWLMKPDASNTPRPTIVVNNGSDAQNFDVYAFGGAAAVERGWNALIFEGPGQGSMLFERGTCSIRV